MIYFVTNPMRTKPIGNAHAYLHTARKSALQAAKRLGHAHIKHWRGKVIETVFSDGTIIKHTQAKSSVHAEPEES